MHNAFLMRRRERVAQRTGNLNDLFNREPGRGDQAVKWLPFDELHSQEVDSIAFLH